MVKKMLKAIKWQWLIILNTKRINQHIFLIMIFIVSFGVQILQFYH